MRCSTNLNPLALRRSMESPLPLPSFAGIVVAAGKGVRAEQPIAKQFAAWRGKPVVRHSVEKLLDSGASPIVVVIPAGAEQLLSQALEGLQGWKAVVGGETRQQSVLIGLEAIASAEIVLIHDAARPDIPYQVIERLLAALTDHPGAIPVLPVVDSLVFEKSDLMGLPADRELLRRVQTPQAFHYDTILQAHLAWDKRTTASDDAQVLQAFGGEVALVEGDERLKKLTFANDFEDARPPVRIGTGFDVHKLAAGEELWLAGVKIESEYGLAGHSDADVALHAVVDALLGAIACGDIGSHFPPSDPQWKGASSDRFLQHAAKMVESAGFRVGNIDLTIICEAPKIGPHRNAMRGRIAELLGVDIEAVSVKATTTEGLGFAGRGEGIAAQAVATVLRT